MSPHAAIWSCYRMGRRLRFPLIDTSVLQIPSFPDAQARRLPKRLGTLRPPQRAEISRAGAPHGRKRAKARQPGTEEAQEETRAGRPGPHARGQTHSDTGADSQEALTEALGHTSARRFHAGHLAPLLLGG